MASIDHAPTPPVPGRRPPGAVTDLLQRWTNGDAAALDRLLPLVYDDLRYLARRHLRRERDGHTLQGTGLLHEAYIRLARQHPVEWHSRTHFFGWASTLMRHVLVDYARARQAEKRGAGAPVQSLDALADDHSGAARPWEPSSAFDSLSDAASHDLIALDQALQRLEQFDPRQSAVVELRFFGGLSVQEAAEALDISPTSVKREWATARVWLLRELGRMDSAPRAGNGLWQDGA